MERLTTTKAYDNDKREVLPITLGGTNAATKEQAAINLNALQQSNLGVNNGVATLDSNLHIPLSQLEYLPGREQPSLYGPSSVYDKTSTIYTITNYDSETTYIVTVNKGTISRIEDQITYTANGAFVSGGDTMAVVITINGRTVGILVQRSSINQPSVLSPLDDESSVSLNPVFTTTPITFTGFNDTIDEYEWQLSETSDFSVLIPLNSQHQVITPLTISTPYFVRVRVHGTQLGWSAWSSAHAFTTTSSVIPSNETQIISYSQNNNELAYYNVTLSSDGSVLLTRVLNLITNVASVVIYKKINNVWTFAGEIPNPHPLNANAYGFGGSIAILPDNQTIFISNPDFVQTIDQNIYGLSGIVYVFKTIVNDDYTAMTNVAEIIETPEVNLSLGRKLALNKLGTRLFVCAEATDNTVYIYDIINSLPVPNTGLLIDPSYHLHNLFYINDDGTRLIIGNDNYDNSNGIIVIYDYANGEWTLTDTLSPDQTVITEYFGWPCAISHDGNTIVVGNYPDDPPNYQSHLYVFKLINDVWTQTQKIVNPDWSEASLGYPANIFVFSQDDNYVLAGFKSNSIPDNVGISGPFNETGYVDIYKFNTGDLTYAERLIASDYTPGDYFGSYVAVSDNFDTIFVTAENRYDVNPNYRGAIYVFK